MKQSTVLTIVIVLFSLVAMVACDSQEETAQPKTDVSVDDVKKETAEAVESAKKYTMAQKESYVQEVDSKLEALDRDIEALGNRIQAGTDEIKAESQAELQQALTALRAHKAEAERQYQELKDSSGEAWSDLKASMDSAMEDLNAAFERAKAQFQ